MDAPRANDKSLEMIVVRATCTGALAGLEISWSRTARQNAYADASSNHARSTNALLTESMSSSVGAHNPRDHSECGAKCLFSCGVEM